MNTQLLIKLSLCKSKRINKNSSQSPDIFLVLKSSPEFTLTGHANRSLSELITEEQKRPFHTSSSSLH